MSKILNYDTYDAHEKDEAMQSGTAVNKSNKKRIF